MSQEIDQLAARVAGLVRDEVAAAELRGRSAGHAAGREEMRREMLGQVEALESRISELEARTPAAAPPGAFEDSERRQREREEHEKSKADAKANLPVLPPSDSKKTKGDGKAAKK